MADWNVTGLVRRDRQRKTAEMCAHGVETCRLRVHGNNTAFTSACDPRLKPLACPDGFVFGPVYGGASCGLNATARQSGRRHRTIGALGAVLEGQLRRNGRRLRTARRGGA